jgi:hypothetical protein
MICLTEDPTKRMTIVKAIEDSDRWSLGIAIIGDQILIIFLEASKKRYPVVVLIGLSSWMLR